MAAAPAAPAGEKPPHRVDMSLPVIGRLRFDIPRVPGEDTMLQAVDFLDTKLPTIKGRPALREVLANARPGVTVALVSLPLSISLAIAAAATPVQGIITGCWAGLTSAVAGGSHFNIVGPTGALSGILSYYSVTYGAGIQPLLAVMTGLLSLMVWWSRIDKYLVFIPGAVMHGFTLGVAFIISANQLNFLLGLPKLKKHPEFLKNIAETFSNLDKVSFFAIFFFLAGFTFIFRLGRKYGKVPWAVVLAIVGICIGAGFEATGSHIPLQTIRTQYGDLKLQLITVPDVFINGLDASVDVWLDLFKGAVSITAVAVLETLISARIADRMTKTLFDQRREVMSVALSNLISGLAGGIPATAALARTALNIKSGATSRGAGIMNAITMIFLSTLLFPAFKYLPLPVVAAILVNTAFKMVEWHEITLLMATDRPMFIVALVSGIVCVVEDPTIGIVYGTFLSMIRLLLGLMHGQATLNVYRGTHCEMQYHFTLGVKDSIVKARALYLGEEEHEGDHSDAHGHGAAPQATLLGEASEALKKAKEEVALATVPKPEELAKIGGTAAVNAEGHYHAVESDPDSDARLPKVAVYTISGALTFIAAQSHLDRIRGLFIEGPTSLPNVGVVVFGLETCYYIDPDTLEAVGDLVNELTRAGKTVFMLGFQSRVKQSLKKCPWFAHVATFGDYGALLLHLRELSRLEHDRAGSDGAALPFQEYVTSRIKDAAQVNATAAGGTNPSLVAALHAADVSAHARPSTHSSADSASVTSGSNAGHAAPGSRGESLSASLLATGGDATTVDMAPVVAAAPSGAVEAVPASVPAGPHDLEWR